MFTQKKCSTKTFSPKKNCSCFSCYSIWDEHSCSLVLFLRNLTIISKVFYFFFFVHLLLNAWNISLFWLISIPDPLLSFSFKVLFPRQGKRSSWIPCSKSLQLNAWNISLYKTNIWSILIPCSKSHRRLNTDISIIHRLHQPQY